MFSRKLAYCASELSCFYQHTTPSLSPLPLANTLTTFRPGIQPVDSKFEYRLYVGWSSSINQPNTHTHTHTQSLSLSLSN